MIYICCVGFASHDVVCNEVNDCAWNLGLSVYAYCVEEAIWLNPFVTVLFNGCSAVNVQCCVLYPCCVGVFAVM